MPLNNSALGVENPKLSDGRCAQTAQRLLRMHAIRRTGPPRVRAFYAMAYNPWGSAPERYAHTFGNNYLDMNNQVLLGRQFWEYVGDANTKKELLEIYQEVGREKGPDMIDRLALGY